MIPPQDPFSERFDSIEVDPARASTALEHALAVAAPAGKPAFQLIDDAGGRFVVDPEFGVVSLKDESLLERERGQVRKVRVRVTEASGTRYELELRLRITGLVPQVVDTADDILAHAPQVAPDLKPVARVALLTPRATVAWATFAAWQGAGAAAPLSCCGGAPYGAVVKVDLPRENVSFASLILTETVPAPFGRNAIWPI